MKLKTLQIPLRVYCNISPGTSKLHHKTPKAELYFAFGVLYSRHSGIIDISGQEKGKKSPDYISNQDF